MSGKDMRALELVIEYADRLTKATTVMATNALEDEYVGKLSALGEVNAEYKQYISHAAQLWRRVITRERVCKEPTQLKE